MIRWLSIGVISYMILGIIWWGFLLFEKNEQLFDMNLQYYADEVNVEEIRKEYSRQKLMIIGEGVVLGISLLLGIYIINKSASTEIQNARRQNDFLLSVSHELKSPIASLKLAIQTLTRSGIDNNDKSKILKGSMSEAKRLEDLVQNILLSANIDDNRFKLFKEPVRIKSFLSEIIRSYQNKNAVIQSNCHELTEEYVMSLDKMNMEQAIRNVLDNAIKYNKSSEPIQLDSTADHEILIISVSNSGDAIQSKDRNEIFKKFQRGSDKETRGLSGTGIGLYIASEVVKAHKGQLSYNHRENRNIFEIQLPAQ